MEGWIAVTLGGVLALCILPMELLSYALGYLKILAHEMGHAIVGWLYGYPSIPAFDFVYGGGVTSHSERIVALAVCVQAALLWIAWLFFRNTASFAIAAGACAFYATTAWTSLHDPLIIAMGHGTELVIAGVFLHRAFSGRACHHGAERVAYAFTGWFITFVNLDFAYGLTTNSFEREMYEQAKGGGHWGDFSRLAEHHLHTSLESVAGAFFALCLVPPALAFLGNHYHAASVAVIARLRQV